MSEPLIGLLTPVKAGMGAWLAGFYGDFVPDTKAGAEWASRGQALAMGWAAGRMVDDVESMLSSWKRNDHSGKASTSAYIPTILAAVSNEYVESPAEAGRHVTDRLPFSFPDDPQHRSFQVTVRSLDLRAQIVVVAQEPQTAMSIVSQLARWAMARPRFLSTYTWKGLSSDWPTVLVQSDRFAVPTPGYEQIVVLTLDLVLRASVPTFFGPDDGYPVVQAVEVHEADPNLGPPTGVTADEWAAYRQMTSAGAPQVVLGGIAQPRAGER